MTVKSKKKGAGKNDELKKYYTLGLPLLGLMALIAVAGILATVAINWLILHR